ncbi:hypothetical protein MTO96_009865 [Rhipicephalus appendiculatus]
MATSTADEPRSTTRGNPRATHSKTDRKTTTAAVEEPRSTPKGNPGATHSRTDRKTSTAAAVKPKSTPQEQARSNPPKIRSQNGHSRS